VPPAAPANADGTDDKEKAQLIMQVLQLTPEQINMLPDEQRRSILTLKEQLRQQGKH
jgi:cleavage stimulation factor subunit 2